MDALRDDGWVPWVVERRIGPFTKDLYGCIDILALRQGVTLAIQVTSGDNHAARSIKVLECEHLALMIAAGWQVQVWSYRKMTNGRYARRVELINDQVGNKDKRTAAAPTGVRVERGHGPGQAAGSRATAAQGTA